jgi:hypothetical protein
MIVTRRLSVIYELLALLGPIFLFPSGWYCQINMFDTTMVVQMFLLDLKTVWNNRLARLYLSCSIYGVYRHYYHLSWGIYAESSPSCMHNLQYKPETHSLCRHSPRFTPAEVDAMRRSCVFSPSVGTTLLLETDRCRAWDFSYPPGGGDPLDVHQHTLDYIFCTPCGGPAAVESSVRLLGYNPDGSLQFDSLSRDGQVRPRRKGFVPLLRGPRTPPIKCQVSNMLFWSRYLLRPHASTTHAHIC